MDAGHLYPPAVIDPETPAAKRAREAVTAVTGFDQFLYGGMSGSTDLGFVQEILKPQKLNTALFGLARIADIRAHGADEFVYIRDLVDMTKELVHYFSL